jgi:putative endonuclease
MLNLFQHPSRHKFGPMRDERQPCVYILASGRYGTLYIGVTSSLVQRMWRHRNDVLPGFTRDHGVHRLVHFEMFGQMIPAIAREKQLKRWHRQWKINLINAANPDWTDLAAGLGLPPLARGRTMDGP